MSARKRNQSPNTHSRCCRDEVLPKFGPAIKATGTDSLSSSGFVYNGPRQDSTTVCAKVAASCDDWSPYRIGGKAAGCPLLRFRLLINPPRLSPHRDAVRRLFAAAENEPPLLRNQMIYWQRRDIGNWCTPVVQPPVFYFRRQLGGASELHYLSRLRC